MHPSNVTFSKADTLILNSYKTVTRGLSNYLGPGYEIVLHSLEDLNHSVVEIINGHHTSRKVGAPITDLALSMLSKINEQPDTNEISYFCTNKNGEPLKSSTIVIRGEKGNPIGLLCINFYLNTPFSSILQNFVLQNTPLQENSVSENFTDNVEDLIQESLREAKERVCHDASISSSNRNKEIISILYQRGIFNLKDSVLTVSALLGISKNTVYMHLRNLK